MTIAMRAAECAQLFEGMSQAATSDMLRQDWENQIFRFNLWSANNFIFAPTRASMDWRLRNAPLLESTMVELLDDLRSSLIKSDATMKAMVTQEDRFSPLDAVGEGLEGLFRLSRAVRRSGILRRFVKVASYVEYDENGVNLTEGFRKDAERIIEFRLKHSAASQSLQRRIVDTVCLRQQHFAYLRAKWEKGRGKREDTNASFSMLPKSALKATFSATGSISSSASKSKRKKAVNLPMVVPSMLTATTAQPERIRRAYSIKSANNTRQDEVYAVRTIFRHRRRYHRSLWSMSVPFVSWSVLRTTLAAKDGKST
ncbi:hypothetical protein BDW59DRAFT_152021 [Aspergillus cavernicola]|uniref:Uncharacterized protein n=1 Tax=Aspergillus cavernicola TaxID=176166 RepID=A0ABR4HSQ8_9EURO